MATTPLIIPSGLNHFFFLPINAWPFLEFILLIHPSIPNTFIRFLIKILVNFGKIEWGRKVMMLNIFFIFGIALPLFCSLFPPFILQKGKGPMRAVGSNGFGRRGDEGLIKEGEKENKGKMPGGDQQRNGQGLSSGLCRFWEEMKAQFGRNRGRDRKRNGQKKRMTGMEDGGEGQEERREGGGQQKVEEEEEKEEEERRHENAQKAEEEEEEEEEEEAFVTFCLQIHLREGHGLAVRDASGSSDPYVKCLYKGCPMYRSETIFMELNPKWDEQFAFLLDDPTEELCLKVFDYDRFMKDDFMGAARVELSTLPLFRCTEMELELEDPRGQCAESPLGTLSLSVTLTPLTERQREQFLKRTVRGIVVEHWAKRSGQQSQPSSIVARVNILLVDAKLPMIEGGRGDIYAKFRIGTEKHKSKAVAGGSPLRPKWREQFELLVFDSQTRWMNVCVCEQRARGTILGRCSVDLAQIQPEQTSERWYPLNGDSGAVRLLLTISPSSRIEREQQIGLASTHDLWHSIYSTNHIGVLTVNVIEADALASADLNGKSDPFCVLELVNVRAQTHTEFKTLSPKWNRTFTFGVGDIHEVLELTVFDEDPHKRVEFLGKLAIPLLRIRNGENRWYALKDKKLTKPVKGRIRVEATIHYNWIRAALRTFTPRERKLARPVEHFKRTKFVANLNRIGEAADSLLGLARLVHSCLCWHSYPKSICALALYSLFVLFIQLWHFPFILFLLFLRSLVQKQLSDAFESWARRRWTREKTGFHPDHGLNSSHEHFGWRMTDRGEERWEDRMMKEDEEEEEERMMEEIIINGREKEDEVEENAKSIERKEEKSLRARIRAIQGTLLQIQTGTGAVLALMERCKNTLNFSVPFLSLLAMLVLLFATLLLYTFPLRWILLIWGLNKFSKRLLNPEYVDNNELLDFLSRAPSHQELLQYRTNFPRHSTPLANETFSRSESNESSRKRKKY